MQLIIDSKCKSDLLTWIFAQYENAQTANMRILNGNGYI